MAVCTSENLDSSRYHFRSMSSPRARAVLFGHDYRLAGGVIALAALSGGLLATGTLRLPSSTPTGSVWVVIAALAIVPAVYAYWNDGLTTCWLFVFSLVFGGTYHAHANRTGDVGFPQSPLEYALFFAVFFAAFGGPLAFVFGAGVRDLLERVEISERLSPRTTVPLRVVLLGPSPRTISTPLYVGTIGAVVLGGGMALAGDPLTGQPPTILRAPLFWVAIFTFTAVVEWRYGGLFLACGASFLALLGLFVGGLVGPEDAVDAVRGGLWYGLLMTLSAGLPGAIVATLPRLRPNSSRNSVVGVVESE